MKPASNCVEFRLSGSRHFATAAVLLHGLAALMIVAGPFPAWSLGLLPLLALSLWRGLRLDRETALLRCSGEDWFLVDASGEALPLHWLPSTRIGPRLTLLHARSTRGRHFWPVAGDSLPADEFRRLRALVGSSGKARR